MRRDEAFRRLSRAQAEYLAARFAIRRVLETWNADATLARAAKESVVTEGELRRSADHMEVTFTLRLFAEFEAVLRDYWRDGVGRPTEPEMRPLMDSVARRRQMNGDDLAAAHDVRRFRNDVIHAGLLVPRLKLNGCLTGLGRYLRWLPQQW